MRNSDKQKRLRRLFRMLSAASLRTRARTGLTLAEMAIAMAVATMMTVLVTTTVSDGLRLQGEADRLSVAVALAETKLSQLLSNPNLSTSNNRGTMGDDTGIYAGYTYDIKITEEKIDLAKSGETGELNALPVGDQMPAGATNTAANPPKMGESTKTETGGTVDIVRIVVKIIYPRGRSGPGEYRVETFRGAAKKE
ncbi:MAG: hypothetical protein HY042_05140 [Spirochaetia bacterium]|nr:hypothetical protein [Spirochaetia bacterium]